MPKTNREPWWLERFTKEFAEASVYMTEDLERFIRHVEEETRRRAAEVANRWVSDCNTYHNETFDTPDKIKGRNLTATGITSAILGGKE